MHLDCDNSNYEGAKLCQFTPSQLFHSNSTVVKCVVLHTANIFLPLVAVNLERVLKVKYSS